MVRHPVLALDIVRHKMHCCLPILPEFHIRRSKEGVDRKLLQVEMVGCYLLCNHLDLLHQSMCGTDHSEEISFLSAVAFAPFDASYALDGLNFRVFLLSLQVVLLHHFQRDMDYIIKIPVNSRTEKSIANASSKEKMLR